MADSQIQDTLVPEQEVEETPRETTEEMVSRRITELGLDQLDEAAVDVIKKELLAAEKKTHIALKQKERWKEKAQQGNKVSPELPKESPKSPSIDVDALLKQAEERVRAEFEKRDLESLELEDELKEEVKVLAKAKGVSVKQAASEPYILFRKEQAAKKRQEDEASISRTKNSPNSTTKFSKTTPPDVDASTPEGRQQIDEWLKWIEKQS